MKCKVALVAAFSVLVFGLAGIPGVPVSAQGQAQLGVAQGCFEHHRFGALPVDVAKTADGRTVLAQTSWNWHDSIGCFLTLDQEALAVLRAAPPPQSLPVASTDASKRCFGHHRFGERPVDVAKSSDGQTVIARLSWGYHDSIGCYLVLDDTALANLRAAGTGTEADQPVAVPAPENRSVLAQRSVSAAGAVVSYGQVSVSVPAGAIDGQAEVVIREPLGDFGDEVGGEPVGVEHAAPVRAPITVRWDVSHLSELQQQVLVLARWDEQVENWVPDDSPYRIDDGVLIAEIQQWTELGWFTDKLKKVAELNKKALRKVVEVNVIAAEKVVEAVKEAQEIGETVSQTVLEVAGARVDAPECATGALHSWVEQAAEPDEGFAPGVIWVCYENGPGESVRAKLANNRTFAQFIEIKGGDGYLRPVLSGVDSTLEGLAWSIAHGLLTDEQRVFVPPLATVQVDIPRPSTPGDHTIRFRNLAEEEAIVADAVVYLVELIDPIGAVDNDTFAAVIDVLIVCAQNEVQRAAQNASTPSFSQIAGHVADCLFDIPKVGTDANNLFIQKRLDRAQESAVSIALDDVLGKIAPKSRNARRAVKYLIAAEIAFYGIDLFIEGIKGLTTWKITGQGQTQPDPEPTTTQQTRALKFNAVSAGRAHTCALRTDRTAACWGADSHGQSSPPAGRFTAVAAGWGHTCGLKADNTVACWGTNWDGESDPPTGGFAAVTAGERHSCGLRPDQTVVCWGRNKEGQSGAPVGRFTAVAAGDWHSCAIRTGGSLVCWGDDEFGQAAPPAGTFAAVATGGSHSCAIRTGGQVECWGSNWSGESDPPTGTFTAVAVGNGHSCAIEQDQTIDCWGSNSSERAFAPYDQYSSVSAGASHTCGLTIEQAIICWGANGAGQADWPGPAFTEVSVGYGRSSRTCGLRVDGTYACWGSDHFLPASHYSYTREHPPDYTVIAAGGSHTCGLQSYGTMFCSGWNYAGQVSFPRGIDLVDLSAGGEHTCGVADDRTVVCWGNDNEGQSDAPSGRFAGVAAGSEHSCGVADDRTVVCWGNNNEGQSDAPSGRFAAVAAGSEHSCGVADDRTVVCWGNNNEGQSDAPSGRFAAVAAAERHSCGLRPDQAVVCWGEEPFTESPAGRFTSIAAAGRQTCGVRPDGTIQCWGAGASRHGVPTARGEPSVMLTKGGPGPTSIGRGQGVPCAPATPACRYLDVELTGFSPGVYSSSCSHDGWGEIGPSVFWTFTITVDDSGTATSRGPCFLNFARLTGNGVYVTVIGNDVNATSNWLK